MADVLLCTDTFWAAHGPRLKAVAPALDVVELVGAERVDEADRERVTLAYWSPDLANQHDRRRAFLGACLRSPGLRWLQTSFVGTDDPVFASLGDRGVVVTNAAGTNAQPIAQMVAGYILSFSCQLPRLARAQRAHSWEPGQVIDLEGMRLGIVGMGAIGAEVARLALALRMDVVGLRRRVTGEEPCETWTDDQLTRLLAWCDVLVVAAPLTEQTRGMIAADQLATMRPGSWFVNVGRGEIVDEQALVDSLHSGHIGAAGLDVFATEPLPHDSPLWDMPNVIVTPHTSGGSSGSDRRAIDLFVDNFARYAAGGDLRNVTHPA